MYGRIRFFGLKGNSRQGEGRMADKKKMIFNIVFLILVFGRNTVWRLSWGGSGKNRPHCEDSESALADSGCDLCRDFYLG